MSTQGAVCKGDWRHPELRDGEVHLGNFDRMGFVYCGYKTKRMGNVPFNPITHESTAPIDGLPDVFPVFVQRTELEAAGIPILGTYSVLRDLHASLQSIPAPA